MIIILVEERAGARNPKVERGHSVKVHHDSRKLEFGHVEGDECNLNLHLLKLTSDKLKFVVHFCNINYADHEFNNMILTLISLLHYPFT